MLPDEPVPTSWRGRGRPAGAWFRPAAPV